MDKKSRYVICGYLMNKHNVIMSELLRFTEALNTPGRALVRKQSTPINSFVKNKHRLWLFCSKSTQPRVLFLLPVKVSVLSEGNEEQISEASWKGRSRAWLQVYLRSENSKRQKSPTSFLLGTQAKPNITA